MKHHKPAEEQSTEVALQSSTEVTERIDTMVSNRAHIIGKIKPMLIENVDVYTLPGMKKLSLGKPGAEKLAAIFGLRASFKVDAEIAGMIGGLDDRKYVAYVCTLTHNGEFAGEGRGATFVELTRTQYKNMNAKEFAVLAPTIDPSDYQQKQGQYGLYYRVKDGVVFDQLALNKAIKMAQKSAFVDAVIRTTGMSDLFTQDIEDAPSVSVEEPAQSVEPDFSDTPATPTFTTPTPASGTNQCPLCKREHTGPYPKCYTCWQNNRKAPQTKQVVNYDEPPF